MTYIFHISLELASPEQGHSPAAHHIQLTSVGWTGEILFTTQILVSPAALRVSSRFGFEWNGESWHGSGSGGWWILHVPYIFSSKWKSGSKTGEWKWREPALWHTTKQTVLATTETHMTMLEMPMAAVMEKKGNIPRNKAMETGWMIMWKLAGDKQSKKGQFHEKIRKMPICL